MSLRALCQNFRDALANSVTRKFHFFEFAELSSLPRVALVRTAELSFASVSPIWAYLGISLPIWSYLGLSGAVRAYLDLSGPIWAYLGLPKPIWAYLDLSGPICPFLGLCGPVWADLSLSGPLWTLAGSIWAYLVISSWCS